MNYKKNLPFAALVVAALLPAELLAAEPEKTPAPPKILEEDCLWYEPGVVTLKGALHRGVSSLMLDLPDPVCINARENDIRYYPQMEDVKTIFFVLEKNESPDKYKDLFNKNVVVTGTLHRKPIDDKRGQMMILVAKVEEAKP